MISENSRKRWLIYLILIKINIKVMAKTWNRGVKKKKTINMCLMEAIDAIKKADTRSKVEPNTE